MILIYQDYVHNSGSLFKALVNFYGVGQVAYADANNIIGGILNSDVRAFFMPGGASRYVADKLNGKGNAAIRFYVENGGVYVGICAGAYYACQRTEWYPDHGPSIVMNDELGFFSGTAQGPIKEFTNLELGWDYTAHITDLQTSTGKAIRTLYRGGPVFISDHPTSFECLAAYNNLPGNPPAIITGIFGQGRYLLSSPHIEVDSEQLALRTFDVVANECKDIAILPSHDGLSTAYFRILLKQYII